MIDEGSKRGERGDRHREKPKGCREMGDQKTIPSDDRPPERKMRFPPSQLRREANVSPKGCRGAWRASSPTHLFYL